MLIRPQDIWPAIDTLASLGYQTDFQGAISQNQKEAILRYSSELLFYHPASATWLDLHWQLYPRWLARRADFDALWRRRETIQILDTPVDTFGSQDLLPYLCLHGSKHGWARLQWLCDVAELLRTTPDLDWESMREQTGKHAFTLWLGLALARDLLDAPLPTAVVRKIAAQPALAQTVVEFRHRLLDPNSHAPALGGTLSGSMVPVVTRVFAHARVKSPSASSIADTVPAFDQSWEHLQLLYLEQGAQATWLLVVHWLGFALRPTPEVIRRLSLPVPLFPLYRFLRLIYLLRQGTLGLGLALWHGLPKWLASVRHQKQS